MGVKLWEDFTSSGATADYVCQAGLLHIIVETENGEGVMRQTQVPAGLIIRAVRLTTLITIQYRKNRADYQPYDGGPGDDTLFEFTVAAGDEVTLEMQQHPG